MYNGHVNVCVVKKNKTPFVQTHELNQDTLLAWVLGYTCTLHVTITMLVVSCQWRCGIYCAHVQCWFRVCMYIHVCNSCTSTCTCILLSLLSLLFLLLSLLLSFPLSILLSLPFSLLLSLPPSSLQCTPCREGTGWMTKMLYRFGETIHVQFIMYHNSLGCGLLSHIQYCMYCIPTCILRSLVSLIPW